LTEESNLVAVHWVKALAARKMEEDRARHLLDSCSSRCDLAFAREEKERHLGLTVLQKSYS
jgi:hypothetical protein